MPNLNARVIQKHDTEANWNTIPDFIPKNAELIIYDADENHGYKRMKVGDGNTAINNLPFFPIIPGAHVEIPYLPMSNTQTTVEIEPNVIYEWQEVSSLNITLKTPTNPNIENVYKFYFYSGATPTILYLPSSIMWDKDYSIIPETKYEITITQNCGVIKAFYENNDMVIVANVTITGEEETPYFELTNINYRALMVYLNFPPTDTDYRVLCSLNGRNWTGYIGNTSTTDYTYFASLWDMNYFNGNQLQGGTGNRYGSTNATWLDNIPLTVHQGNRQNISQQRATYLKIGLQDTYSIQLPVGTRIRIYGIKY